MSPGKLRLKSSATAAIIALLVLALHADGQPATVKWFKGNLHTHTNNSDGDSSPTDVAGWFKKNRYDFVVITDHEHITPVAELNSSFGDDGKFLVISGQEITDRFDKKPYHVNGLGITSLALPQRGTGVVSNLQKNIDAVRERGGVPLINHPNFGWAISANDLLKLQRVSLLEVFSGHPKVNIMGGGGFPGVEEIWDLVLSGGRVYYGVAVDDSHHYARPAEPNAASPGRGWVVVRATELSSAAILAALDRGDFYSSNGVELDDYTVDRTGITIRIKEKSGSKYRTQFIGSGGKVIRESISNPAVYRFSGKEKYVRAKILESNGSAAWTQPVFPKKRL